MREYRRDGVSALRTTAECIVAWLSNQPVATLPLTPPPMLARTVTRMKWTARSPSRQIAPVASTVSYMGARPMIVRNPPNDRHFEMAVESVLSSGVTDPATAQELLRKRYPKAVVRPRELAGERTPVWYVYRDGRWTRGD